MSAPGDRLPTTRMSLALLRANTRYWSTVAPLARTQLDHWNRRANEIPDPILREVALTNHREEGFNAQATATLATVAPRAYRRPVVEAVVGLQVIYDYLDSLLERPLTDPLDDGRRLYHAFIDAIVLNVTPRDDYYAFAPHSDDGGYLKDLVNVVRGALTQLPCLSAVAEVSERAANRCADAQVRAHATPAIDSTQLQRWATRNAIDTGLEWQEFLAGSVSSGLALHALIAAAANPYTSQADAHTIDEIYLSICALTTLLDGLIDYEQDMQSMGQPGYIRYYEDHDALLLGLKRAIRQATLHARGAPNKAHHLMTLVGVVAYYSSSPTASHEFARPVTRQIRNDLRPLITPTLAVLRAWRAANRTRTTITSRTNR